MFKYIYRRHGHKDEELSQKTMATFLVSEGCPQQFANIIISQAESRCKMKKTLAEYSFSVLDHFEAVITSELHIELWPDPKPGAVQEQLRMI